MITTDLLILAEVYWRRSKEWQDTTRKPARWSTGTAIGMYLHGFEKLILPDINKRSSLGERCERAENWAIG